MKKHNSKAPSQSIGMPTDRPGKDARTPPPQSMTRERLLEIIETALLITEGFEEQFDLEFQPRIPTTAEMAVEPKGRPEEDNEE